MHRFGPEAQAELSKAHRKAQQKPSKEEDARKSAYLDEDGRLYQPAEHILQSMVKAATSFKVGKKSLKDAVRSNLVIENERIYHQSNDYDIDSRPVVVPATKGRIMRHRPLLKKWRLEFVLEVLDDDDLSFESTKAILDEAGKKIGIGDYRPRFGRFIVTRFERI